jgi:photosystem II stability/assembly factor-like uncharacterized protein
LRTKLTSNIELRRYSNSKTTGTYLYLTCLIFLIFSFHSYPQSITFSSLNGPYGGNLGDVAVTTDGEIFVSAYYSQSKGIYKSTDTGLSWQLLPPIYPYNEFFALGINQNNILFAGTSGGGLYRSTDKGITWTWLQNYGSPECWAIAFNDSDQIFAGDGDWGGLYKSTDVGNTWNQILPNSDKILAVEIDPGGNIYVGTSNNFYKSTDNGDTFTSYYAGLPNSEIASVLSNSQSKIFVGTGYLSQGNGVYFSNDGGVNWTQSGIDSQTVYSLTIDQYENIYAGTQLSGVYKSTDNGITWKQINNGLQNRNVFRVKMIQTDLLFACSETDGGIYRSSDFGNSWLITGMPAGTVYSGFNDDSVNIFTATYGGIQKFDSYSDNWSILMYGGMVDILRTTAENLIACNFSSVFISSDYGINWEQTNPVGSSGLQLLDLEISRDNSILIGTNGYIKMSTDNGNTWITIENGLPSYLIENIKINQEGNVFVTSGDNLCRASSIDDQFQIVIDNVGSIPRNSITTGSNGLIFFTSDVGTFRSMDYGFNWEKISNQFGRSINLHDNRFVNVGLGEDGKGLLFSTNLGDTWIQLNKGLPSNAFITWNDIDVQGYLYAAVGQFGLYKTNSIVTSVEKTISFDNYSFSLKQNYPNPFNPVTSIQYSLSSMQFVTLKIYDVLGNEIATLVNEEKSAGEYEVEFNGNGLTSGIYFYQLKAGESIQTRKMILLK